MFKTYVQIIHEDEILKTPRIEIDFHTMKILENNIDLTLDSIITYTGFLCKKDCLLKIESQNLVIVFEFIGQKKALEIELLKFVRNYLYRNQNLISGDVENETQLILQRLEERLDYFFGDLKKIGSDQIFRDDLLKIVTNYDSFNKTIFNNINNELIMLRNRISNLEKEKNILQTNNTTTTPINYESQNIINFDNNQRNMDIELENELNLRNKKVDKFFFLEDFHLCSENQKNLIEKLYNEYKDYNLPLY